MRKKTTRILRRLVAIPLCLIMLIESLCLFTTCNLQENYSIVEDNISEIEVIETSSTEDSVERVTFDTETTSRSSNINTRLTEYIIYTLNVNGETTLYFESLENAELQRDYLLNNTTGITAEITEITQDNKDNLSDEFTINNTIENYILKYKKITECFPTVSHTISSTYGYRASRGDFHTGIDLSGNYGDPIYAYKSGTVIRVQYSNTGYGNMVLIQHEDGTQTRYAHMSSIKVSNGEYVVCGQIIGGMGSTGNSTGVHLHFEIIINGSTVNPYNYLF